MSEPDFATASNTPAGSVLKLRASRFSISDHRRSKSGDDASMGTTTPVSAFRQRWAMSPRT